MRRNDGKELAFRQTTGTSDRRCLIRLASCLSANSRRLAAAGSDPSTKRRVQCQLYPACISEFQRSVRLVYSHLPAIFEPVRRSQRFLSHRHERRAAIGYGASEANGRMSAKPRLSKRRREKIKFIAERDFCFAWSVRRSRPCSSCVFMGHATFPAKCLKTWWARQGLNL